MQAVESYKHKNTVGLIPAPQFKHTTIVHRSSLNNIVIWTIFNFAASVIKCSPAGICLPQQPVQSLYIKRQSYLQTVPRTWSIRAREEGTTAEWYNKPPKKKKSTRTLKNFVDYEGACRAYNYRQDGRVSESRRGGFLCGLNTSVINLLREIRILL